MNTTAQFVLIAKRILRELSVLSEAVRKGFLAVQEQVEKINRQVESTAREYYAKNREEKPAPAMRGELHRSQSEIDSEEAYKSRVEGRDTKRLIVEFLALVLAGVLAIATIGLWLITRESTKIALIAAEAAQRSAKASEAQAEAAKASVNATVDSFRLDQRAWVGVADISIKNVVIPGHRFIWIGYVQNSGKTPSLNTVMLFKSKTFLKNETPKFIYDRPLKEPQGEISLMPSMKISIGGQENPEDEPLTEPQIRAMREGVTKMYIFGKIGYDDVFKIPHYTHVCAWVDSDLSTTHPCQTYNDAN